MNELIRTFGARELRVIAGGKYLVQLSTLTVIAMASLVVLGLAGSIQDFLSRKMDDPFVRLVEVDWPYDCYSGAGSNPAADFLAAVNGRFQVQDVQSIFKYNRFFLEAKQREPVQAVVGAVKDTSDLVMRLLQADLSQFITDPDKNVLLHDDGSSAGRLTSCEGVIVSVNLLKRLHLPLEAKTLPLRVKPGWSPLPVPISAVVTNLPSELDVLMHQALIEAIDRASGPTVTVESWERGLKNPSGSQFYISEDDWITLSSGIQSRVVKRSAPFHAGGHFMRPKSGALPSGLTLDSYISPADLLGITASSISGVAFSGAPSTIGISFSTIDSIGAFASFVQDESNKSALGCVSGMSGLKVDLSKVKAKENITLFNRIANGLRVALVLATSLLLIFKCNSLFQMHIEKYRASLGTLKAFGLSNLRINGLYVMIASALLSTSVLISYILVSLMGPILLNGVAGQILGIDGDDGIALEFVHFNPVMGVIAFIIVPVAFVAWRIFAVLKLSPGALVFGRKTMQA